MNFYPTLGESDDRAATFVCAAVTDGVRRVGPAALADSIAAESGWQE
jgi:hypothetical protein